MDPVTVEYFYTQSEKRSFMEKVVHLAIDEVYITIPLGITGDSFIEKTESRLTQILLPAVDVDGKYNGVVNTNSFL